MSLQQDVLDTIGPDGIERGKLRAQVGNVGQVELDQVMMGLMRSGRVRLSFGRYELTALASLSETAPTNLAPPSAAEEAAASLQPARKVCKTCHEPKDEGQFRCLPFSERRADECNQCLGRRASAGRARAAERRQAVSQPAVTASATESPSAPGSALENALAVRQVALTKAAALNIELANLRAQIARCDQYIELHQEFAK